MARQVQQFHTMKHLTYEDEEKVVETLKIFGKNAVFELYKDPGEGTLLIASKQKKVVVIQTDYADSKEELILLADDVPLSNISSAIE